MVKFNATMSTGAALSAINNGTIHIENTILPSLDVLVLPENEDDVCSKSLNFTWECTDYEESQMLI